ncbi:MAG: gliding motility lipoprotein GldH [Paludibacteraceae bacterium]|nr:gliding motility lipoprotein GldH [Paludibacteraceae bacterium]
MSKSLRLILFCSVACIFIACDSETLYSGSVSLPLSGWHADSALNFNFAVSDTISPCNVIISVRHTNNYPYQNMWLIVDNSLQNKVDTIEFYLADQRGVWLGSGNSRLREMPILFLENYQFADTAMQHISIRHAMRDTLLRGVSDIGVRIERR